MAGLDPAIHAWKPGLKTELSHGWLRVDTRDKPGHDEERIILLIETFCNPGMSQSCSTPSLTFPAGAGEGQDESVPLFTL